ncbi:hypothetical protein EVJ50_01520 [Synechococcus sp. RSCCF101]|uniref:glycoside hydrolase family 10 protein n=1 Tax=Synechococcus sp. RSCCF101 TaxID=2511069 RepID=UPI0012483DC2|nr:family 10 glycosylhydrolase [Synechococcus sp. RSCCF101]QEY31126.1 hypothetical protein EVJ50_01520 [Synechococcus sp. RSCCF101]
MAARSTRRGLRARGLRLLAALAVAAGATLPAGGAQALPAGGRPPVRVGVWLTNSPSPLYYDRAVMERAVNELADAGFNTLYPNVWSRGTTFHRSRYAPIEPPLAKAGVDLDPICTMSRIGRRRGMKVIPWFEYGLMEPADAAVVQANPDWVLKRRDGSSHYAMHGADLKRSPLKDLRVWLNPAHPGVRERFIGLVVEVLQRCPLNGIQLDDHFAWPVDLGYDDWTRALYEQEMGVAPPADHTNRTWMVWRRKKLTGLLRQLKARLKEEGLPSTISLSPGPFRFAYNTWLQDWELWAFGELIDHLVVQNYAYSVKGFERDLDQPALRKARDWGMPAEIGILAGFGKRTTSMSDLSSKVRLSNERGHGVIYFYWEGLWGQYAGPEGAAPRREAFRRLHRQINPR